MLFKNVWRYFKRQWVLAFLLSIVIFLSAFIYGVMAHSVGSIQTPTEAYFNVYQQEDFHLIPMPQITPFDREQQTIPRHIRTTAGLYEVDLEAYFFLHQARLDHLAQEGLTLEARFNKDITTDQQGESHVFRVLSPNTHVNQTRIVEGRMATSVGEVMILPVYAEAWDLSVGDPLTLEGQTLEIVGLFMVPDYSLVMFGEGFILNTQTRSILMVSDNQFVTFNAAIEASYGVLGPMDTMDTLVESNVILAGFSTRNTIRSGAIYDELAGGEAFGLVLSLLIAFIGVFVVYVMVHKMLNDQRGPIGLLKALGYHAHEIVLPYVLMVFFLALPGLLLGYLVGFIVAPSMTGLYQLLYVLPTTPVLFSWRIFLLSTALPLVVLVGLGSMVTVRLVRVDALKLLSPKALKPPKVKAHKTRLDPTSKRFTWRLGLDYLWRQKAALSVFVLGITSAFYLIFLGLSMTDSFEKMNELTFGEANYAYIGICPLMEGCSPSLVAQGEGAIELPDVLLEDTPVILVGLSPQSEKHPLNAQGTTITHRLEEEGVIITRALALKGQHRVGDVITLKYGDETLEREILGIHEDYLNNRVFMDKTTLSLRLTEGFSEAYVNVVYSQAPLGDGFQTVISLADLRSQTEWLTQLSEVMFFWMTLASFGMGLVVMLLVMMMVFEHKRFDMQVFRLLGYEKKTLNQVFIWPYAVLLLVLLMVSVPLALVTFEVVTFYFATRFNMIFIMTFNPWHIGLVLALAVVLYVLTQWLMRHQWAKTTLAEALSQEVT